VLSPHAVKFFNAHQYGARLRTFAWPYYATLFKFIHQSACTGKTHLEFALQERGGPHPRPHHNFDGALDEIVIVAIAITASEKASTA
jgi:hypothetical protein